MTSSDSYAWVDSVVAQVRARIRELWSQGATWAAMKLECDQAIHALSEFHQSIIQYESTVKTQTALMREHQTRRMRWVEPWVKSKTRGAISRGRQSGQRQISADHNAIMADSRALKAHIRNSQTTIRLDRDRLKLACESRRNR